MLPASLAGAAPPSGPDGWIPFAANWTASGHQRTLVMGESSASIVDLAGALVVTAGDGLSRGFRGEAITFVERGKVGIGRLVLTDERGDQIFTDLEGQAPGTGKRIHASITGGTGRYAGLEGEFAFDWQYVVQGEDGAISGRAVGLTGRYRHRAAASTPGRAPGNAE